MAEARSPSASEVRPSQYSPSAMLFELVAARAQRGEMAHGRMRLVQEAQRDPASEELGLDIGVAGDKPMLGGDLIGDARAARHSARRGN